MDRVCHIALNRKLLHICNAKAHYNENYNRNSESGVNVQATLKQNWTMHHCDNWRIKNQLDATYYFIVRLIGSTCFGHYYAHHQELAIMMLITTLVILFLVCCMLEVTCIPDTTPAWLYLTSNIQQTKNETTDMVMNIIIASSWWW